MGLELPKFRLPKFQLPTIRAAKPAEASPAAEAGEGPAQRGGGFGALTRILTLVTAAALAVVIGLGVFASSLSRKVQEVTQDLRRSQQQVDELSAKNRQLSTRLDDVATEHEVKDARIASLRRQVNEATIELEEARDKLEALQWRYERVSEAKSSSEARAFELTQQGEARQGHITQLKDEKAEVERLAGRLRERLTFMERDYKQMAEQVEELKRKPTPSNYGVVNVTGPTEPSFARASAGRSRGSTVELPPIIVRKDRTGTATPVRARLVEVNEPHRFIVMDKGSMDGVRVGMRFDVVRGAGMVIAKATAVRVRPQLAACDIIRTSSSQSLQVGDVAVQSAR